MKRQGSMIYLQVLRLRIPKIEHIREIKFI